MNITRPTPQEALRMRRDAQARSRKCVECGDVVAKSNTGQLKDLRWLCSGEGTRDCLGRAINEALEGRVS